MRNDGWRGNCRITAAFIFLAALSGARAAYGRSALLVAPENLRPDPFGHIVAADRSKMGALSASFEAQTARAAYVSLHLVVNSTESAAYRLTISSPLGSVLEPSLYREWFHFLPAEKSYVPDALVPVSTAVSAQLPDQDNRVPSQTAQAYWLDVWVPGTARPGKYKLTATLTAGSFRTTVPITIRVLMAVIPDEDAVTLDGNSYGTAWFAEQYPQLATHLGNRFPDSPEFFGLIQAYHRLFFEHRGTFHHLGYGHAGKVAPEFAPELAGSGAGKHIASWERYDRQFGPLLDGSAFIGTHRRARPIPFVYLPINPEWPASFEWWGEPGYEREFVNVVSEMERHFRDKGWTQTRFELFFNHKKRYKGFAWDGDEARFPKDYAYLGEYGRLLRSAVPSNSPVKFVFRADASWTMERQWRDLSGIINFWVCGEGMLSWYPSAPDILRKRGDILWTYGATSSIGEPSSHMALAVVRPWMQHVAGFVRWLVTSPSLDPWFHSNGETEALVYPGERFGIEGPIPSIRLKLQRNAVQEISLLDSRCNGSNASSIRSALARQFNNTTPDDWWLKRPALADGNPEDWSNADIGNATKWPPNFGSALDAGAFARARAYILQLASTQNDSK
jgi:hypothetical protein